MKGKGSQGRENRRKPYAPIFFDGRRGQQILASDIYVKVEGKIETGSHTGSKFSVVYSSGATTKSIGVDYSSASLEGTLAEEAQVEVKLYGYNGSWFLANKVEVEIEGTVTED